MTWLVFGPLQFSRCPSLNIFWGMVEKVVYLNSAIFQFIDQPTVNNGRDKFPRRPIRVFPFRGELYIGLIANDGVAVLVSHLPHSLKVGFDVNRRQIEKFFQPSELGVIS